MYISGGDPQEAPCIYPSDLTNEEWAIIECFFGGRGRRGRPNHWPVRRVLDAVFYVLRSGCAWRLLPHDFPPWQTVFYHFSKWRSVGLWGRLHKVLRAAERQRVGKRPDPSAAIVDSQSVKTAEGGPRGYDAAKNVFGRKRHLLVDTAGLMLATYVTPANVQDREGARRLLAGLKPFVPRLGLIWADGAYGGKELADWCEDQGGWRLEIVQRSGGVAGFSVLPRRWVVERTFAWLGKQRRLSKDYERKVQTSESLIQVAMIRLMLRRLASA